MSHIIQLMSSSPRITAHPAALIAQDADLRGEIILGEGCIVHPRATIIAASGPIHIDADCVVEENAVIINRRKEVMLIGKGNHFMVGCRESSPQVSTVEGDCIPQVPSCARGQRRKQAPMIWRV